LLLTPDYLSKETCTPVSYLPILQLFLGLLAKKSKKGIQTPQSDIELIKQRYKDAQAREQ
jgi:phage-related protein